MVDRRYQHVLGLLQEKRDMLDRISSLLLEKEVIEESEFAALIGEDSEQKASAGLASAAEAPIQLPDQTEAAGAHTQNV